MSTEIDRFEGLIRKYVRISFSKKIVNKGLLYKNSGRKTEAYKRIKYGSFFGHTSSGYGVKCYYWNVKL